LSGDFASMPAKKTKSGLFEAQKFAKSLGELIEALPSEASKQHITLQLETLIQFLGNLKSRLESIPTQRDSEAARMAVDRLQSLFTEVKSNPMLGAAFGIKATVPRQKALTITPEEIENAKLAITRFGSQPTDQIRSSLDGMSLRDLKVLAGAIG